MYTIRFSYCGLALFPVPSLFVIIKYSAVNNKVRRVVGERGGVNLACGHESLLRCIACIFIVPCIIYEKKAAQRFLGLLVVSWALKTLNNLLSNIDYF